MLQVHFAPASGAAGQTLINSHGDVASTHSRTPVQCPAAQDDSYTATYESDSHVGSAAESGIIALLSTEIHLNYGIWAVS